MKRIWINVLRYVQGGRGWWMIPTKGGYTNRYFILECSEDLILSEFHLKTKTSAIWNKLYRTLNIENGAKLSYSQIYQSISSKIEVWNQKSFSDWSKVCESTFNFQTLETNWRTLSYKSTIHTVPEDAQFCEYFDVDDDYLVAMHTPFEIHIFDRHTMTLKHVSI